jgi:SAM-dependent methyltransferase
MTVPDLPDKLDAAWGDPEAWIANGLKWLHLDEVQALINRRVSGDASMRPLAWFANHLAALDALPVRRALVLGCGAGEVERELHAQGWASEIVAFDLSAKVLAVAREAAAGIDSITYVHASMDALPIGDPPFLSASFDAVLGVASVHHCSRLDALYAAVARLLTPDGWFFLNEYVGPDRFQYSSAHMQQVATLAELLPESLLTTRSGQVKRGFRAPTVAEVVAVDPSEAICSSRILPLLAEHFDIVAQRPYGGAVLHVLLADIAQNFLPAEAKPWLTALIEAEEELDRLGLLEQHFSCAIARPRRAASSSPSPAG